MKIVHGMAFPDWDVWMSEEIDENGYYQRQNLEIAMRHVKGRTLAIDGGAHAGTWSRPMSGWFMKVLAFEPTPETFECLVHNVGAAKNVELRNQALGKEHGFVTMTIEDHPKAIRTCNTGAMYVKGGKECDIERITIDSLVLPALDFLKLDVEGSEVDALLGAKDTLRKYRPTVLYENKNHWVRYGYPRSAVRDLLSSLGAHYLERTGTDEVWGW